jgi:hypothetical protein
MPQQLSPFVEERIVAFALGHPGYGPRRIAGQLARERWGGIVVSHNGVWRCLRWHGLNTRGKAPLARRRVRGALPAPAGA